jgi:CMP-N,N'-diacetyllegionaminic acid synthase
MSKKILAIIPARGGSKGVPSKNIKLFCGKPLIYYTIAAAKKSKIFDRIIVSTDSPKIGKVSKKLGVEVPFLRPKHLAQYNSNIVDAVLHLLNYLKDKENYAPDIIFLLQPTSPLRDYKDIIDSYNLFNKLGVESLVSVCKTLPEVWHIVNNRLRLANPSPKKLINRQDRPDTYKPDGSMIYIIKTDSLLHYKDFMHKETAAYVIPKWKAVDIDEMEDFELAEVLYKNRKYFNKNFHKI